VKITQAPDKNDTLDPLDALAGAANDAMAPALESDGDGEGVADPQKLTNAQCLMMVCEIVRDTLCSFAKVTSPKTTMANEVMQPVADSVAAVLDKYGVDLSAAAGDYMIEIKAAITTVPVLLAIRGGLMVELAAAKKQLETVAPGAPLMAVVVDNGGSR
jgi:hypothetical protein